MKAPVTTCPESWKVKVVVITKTKATHGGAETLNQVLKNNQNEVCTGRGDVDGRRTLKYKTSTGYQVPYIIRNRDTGPGHDQTSYLRNACRAS